MLKNSLNKAILDFENQEFINTNINTETSQLLLKKTKLTSINIKLLIEQIEAKKRSQKKLPTWFATTNIYYPNKLNIEQTSSEATAKFKSELISGKSLIDITGGFGVDSFYFSKQVDQVIHCEIDSNLSKIVAHNYNQLNANNITCISKDGISVLEDENRRFNWIYIDPSRRDDIKGKVFLLNDCLPNIPNHLEYFFEYSNNIMIKTSPLLDITSGISELKNVKTVLCIAVNNEVKELLWILEQNYTEEIEIKTVNIKKENNQIFNFKLKEETTADAEYSKPLKYLYEPNAAILKAGAFKVLSKKLNAKKLHKHSHLYTSNQLLSFPGRCFKIENYLPYSKKLLKKEFKNKKANITTRNFPESVINIRKTLSIKDGGEMYLFFTTDVNNIKIVIETRRV